MSFKNEIKELVLSLRNDQLATELPLINNRLKEHYKNNATLDVVMSEVVRVPIAKKFGINSKEHLLSKRLVALYYNDKKELNNESKQKLFNKLSSVKTYNKLKIFSIINTYKNSTDVYKLLIALLLSSGCRPIEIIQTSTFIENGFLLIQDSPAKKRNLSFSITKPLILITPVEFIKSVEIIRNKLKDFGYKNIMNKLNIASKELLKSNSYECRKIYGMLSYLLYSTENMSKEVWLNKVLGHSLNDVNTQTFYSTIKII